MGRFGQRQFHATTLLQIRIREDHLLHRLLRRDPRASGQRKAVRDMHTQLQSQPIGLRNGRMHTLPPILGQLIRITTILPATRIVARTDRHQIGSTQSGLRHSLQISSHRLIRDRAIHPIPQRPGFGIARRGTESLFQRLRRSRERTAKQEHQACNFAYNGVHKYSSSVFYKYTKSPRKCQTKGKKSYAFTKNKKLGLPDNHCWTAPCDREAYD